MLLRVIVVFEIYCFWTARTIWVGSSYSQQPGEEPDQELPQEAILG